MSNTIYAALIEHNTWANLEILAACSELADDQLDATPMSTEQWSIRKNLTHLVEAQQGYLSLLTLPPEGRERASLTVDELENSLRSSGAGLLALVMSEDDEWLSNPVHSTDGYRIEPWVVLAQIIDHGAEHRLEIKNLMEVQGLDAPQLDGWAFGDATGALIRMTD